MNENYLQLRIWAEQYEDAQKARIACEHRMKRGGVDPLAYADTLAAHEHAEDAAGKTMKALYRRAVHPDIRAWQQATPGIGEHLLARLIGVVGDPSVAVPYRWEGVGKGKRKLIAGEPYDRTLRELWSYCGHGDPARRRRAGMDQEDALACGSPRAKSLVHLIAESCIGFDGQPDKNGRPRALSPFRKVYDEARTRYAGRTHDAPCVRCGPSGKPAKVGSKWNPGHQHAAALRMVGKEILRDLWILAATKEEPRTGYME